jgi:hypothetical protein
MTIGKMENPFVFSDMVFDGDYTPEGLGCNWPSILRKRTASSSTAAHSHWMKSARKAKIRICSADRCDWNPPGTSIGLHRSEWAWLAIENEQALANTVAHGESGAESEQGQHARAFEQSVCWRARGCAGLQLQSGYCGCFGDLHAGRILALQSAVPDQARRRFHPQPERGHGEQAWSAGITFGKAGKKGLWEVSYRYKYLEADAWYEELTDSDFGAFYQAAPAGGGGLRFGHEREGPRAQGILLAV